jgi:hypothetical protein
VGRRQTPPVEGAKLLGLITADGAGFLKMTGPAALVEPQREAFLALAASLRARAAPAPSPHASTDTAPPRSQAPLSFTVPEGWVEKPSASSVRLVTLAPRDAPRVEVLVTVLPGDVGGVKENVDEWRKQLGLGPTTSSEFAALERREVLGSRGVYAEVEGSYHGKSEGPGIPGAMLVGLIVPWRNRTVFVKMTGPSDEVRGERERFRAFAESLRE